MRAAGHAPNTICSYTRTLEWLVEILGNIKLTSITGTHLDNVIIKLNETGRSAATMNRIKCAIRSFFKWSFETERLTNNPAACLRLAKTRSRRTVPITLAEITTLFDTIRLSCDPHSERDEALFATYAFTGIRRAEALAAYSIEVGHPVQRKAAGHSRGSRPLNPVIPATLSERSDAVVFL